MNNLILDGVLLNDPVTRKVDLQNGSTSVVNFTVVNQDGKTKSPVNCEAWGPKGKDVNRFRAGDRVCVVGGIQGKEYKGQDGTMKSFMVVRVNQITGTTLPSDDSGSAHGSGDNSYRGYGNQGGSQPQEYAEQRTQGYDAPRRETTYNAPDQKIPF